MVNLAKGGSAKGSKGGKSVGGNAVSLSIKWDDRAIQGNLAEVDRHVKRAMVGAMVQLAPRAEAWMKSHAPWQDRTGNARNGLTARVEVVDDGKTARLVCSHTVPYGIWLEVRWSGRYQIVGPAIQKFGPEAMTLVGRLLDFR